jgi:hypothetical protein
MWFNTMTSKLFYVTIVKILIKLTKIIWCLRPTLKWTNPITNELCNVKTDKMWFNTRTSKLFYVTIDKKWIKLT